MQRKEKFAEEETTSFIASLPEFKRKHSSSLMESKDCEGLRGIVVPARGYAGGLQPLPVGTCLPDRNGCRFKAPDGSRPVKVMQ